MDPTSYILSLMSDLTFDEKIRMVEQIVDEIYQEYLPLGSHLLPTEFKRFLVLWNRAVEKEMGSWDREAKREFKKRPEAQAYLEEYGQFCEKYATEVAAVLAYQRDATATATATATKLEPMREGDADADADAAGEEDDEPPPPPPPLPVAPPVAKPVAPPVAKPTPRQDITVAFAPYMEGSQKHEWKHYPHCRFLAGTHVFSAHFPTKEAAFSYALGRYTIVTHSNRKEDPYYFGFYRPGKSFAPHQTVCSRYYSTWHSSVSYT